MAVATAVAGPPGQAGSETDTKYLEQAATPKKRGRPPKTTVQSVKSPKKKVLVSRADGRKANGNGKLPTSGHPVWKAVPASLPFTDPSSSDSVSSSTIRPRQWCSVRIFLYSSTDLISYSPQSKEELLAIVPEIITPKFMETSSVPVILIEATDGMVLSGSSLSSPDRIVVNLRLQRDFACVASDLISIPASKTSVHTTAREPQTIQELRQNEPTSYPSEPLEGPDSSIHIPPHLVSPESRGRSEIAVPIALTPAVPLPRLKPGRKKKLPGTVASGIPQQAALEVIQSDLKTPSSHLAEIPDKQYDSGSVVSGQLEDFGQLVDTETSKPSTSKGIDFLAAPVDGITSTSSATDPERPVKMEDGELSLIAAFSYAREENWVHSPEFRQPVAPPEKEKSLQMDTIATTSLKRKRNDTNDVQSSLKSSDPHTIRSSSDNPPRKTRTSGRSKSDKKGHPTLTKPPSLPKMRNVGKPSKTLPESNNSLLYGRPHGGLRRSGRLGSTRMANLPELASHSNYRKKLKLTITTVAPKPALPLDLSGPLSPLTPEDPLPPVLGWRNVYSAPPPVSPPSASLDEDNEPVVGWADVYSQRTSVLKGLKFTKIQKSKHNNDGAKVYPSSKLVASANETAQEELSAVVDENAANHESNTNVARGTQSLEPGEIAEHNASSSTLASLNAQAPPTDTKWHSMQMLIAQANARQPTPNGLAWSPWSRHSNLHLSVFDGPYSPGLPIPFGFKLSYGIIQSSPGFSLPGGRPLTPISTPSNTALATSPALTTSSTLVGSETPDVYSKSVLLQTSDSSSPPIELFQGNKRKFSEIDDYSTPSPISKYSRDSGEQSIEQVRTVEEVVRLDDRPVPLPRSSRIRGLSVEHSIALEKDLEFDDHSDLIPDRTTRYCDPVEQTVEQVPIHLPPEVEVFVDAYVHSSPVLLVTSREIMRAYCDTTLGDLPVEFQYMYMGFFRILFVKEERIFRPSADSPAGLILSSDCKFGRMQWRFGLEWIGAGEENLDLPSHLKLDRPWWRDTTSWQQSPDEAIDPPIPNLTSKVSIPRPHKLPPDGIPSPSSVEVVSNIADSDNDSSPRFLAQYQASPNYSPQPNPFKHQCPSIIWLSLLARNDPVSDQVGDIGSPRGWYCNSCGKLNRQRLYRRRKCSSSFCKDTSPTACSVQSLEAVRSVGQSTPLVFPLNTVPAYMDPVICEWDDGMKTAAYRVWNESIVENMLAAAQYQLQSTTLVTSEAGSIGHADRVTKQEALESLIPLDLPWQARILQLARSSGALGLAQDIEETAKKQMIVAKHIFTCNDARLQEEQTELLSLIQENVILQKNGPADTPYFSYVAGIVPDNSFASHFINSGIKPDPWADVPTCIGQTRDLMQHVWTVYGEMTQPSCVDQVTVLGWTVTGKKKGEFLLQAKQKGIIIMSLGHEVGIKIVPKSGFPGNALRVKADVAKVESLEQEQPTDSETIGPPVMDVPTNAPLVPEVPPSNTLESDVAEVPPIAESVDLIEGPRTSGAAAEEVFQSATENSLSTYTAGSLDGRPFSEVFSEQNLHGLIRMQSDEPENTHEPATYEEEIPNDDGMDHHTASLPEIGENDNDDGATESLSSGRRVSAKKKGSAKEDMQFLLVHGDALLLSGDDFEYWIERKGMGLLLFGTG
ncbi:hypothetical protein GYMLUDRAFT_34854 [Collybiopsis luxurians FD-317 M1]|nr:hypothetical protein GYMLUDRAFT_34854 [Collybiopsis luxurians FD-317 M1]